MNDQPEKRSWRSLLENQQPRRHLVFDQVEEFTGRDGSKHSLRIRVWRGTKRSADGCDVELVPVVLVSQHDTPGREGISPNMLVKRVSNWVYQAILGFHPAGMMYSQATHHEEIGWEIQRVYFERYGLGSRARLVKPISGNMTWAELENLVGEAVSR